MLLTALSFQPINATDDIRTCSVGWSAICGCGYSGVSDMFSVLYPDNFTMAEDNAGTSGHLFRFNQDEFFPNNSALVNGFKEYGYAYIPYNCRPETGIKCHVHFAFHGCGQNFPMAYINKIPEFVLEAGYLEAADANNIIVIFAMSWPDLKFRSLNYIGCYDIYSYTSLLRIKFGKWNKLL